MRDPKTSATRGMTKIDGAISPPDNADRFGASAIIRMDHSYPHCEFFAQTASYITRYTNETKH